MSRSGFSQRAQTLRAAPFRSAMCTGKGFSQVHQSDLGVNACSATAGSFTTGKTEGPAGFQMS